MNNLLKLARVQAVSVEPTTTVIAAVEAMAKASVGAVIVEEAGQLVGIFTERDVMLRVVKEGRDPGSTLVRDVMTSPALSIRKDEATPDDVLKIMADRHIRHLPVLGATGKAEGVLSMRHLLARKIEQLTREMDSLEAFMAADGIGG